MTLLKTNYLKNNTHKHKRLYYFNADSIKQNYERIVHKIVKGSSTSMGLQINEYMCIFVYGPDLTKCEHTFSIKEKPHTHTQSTHISSDSDGYHSNDVFCFFFLKEIIFLFFFFFK